MKNMFVFAKAVSGGHMIISYSKLFLKNELFKRLFIVLSMLGLILGLGMGSGCQRHQADDDLSQTSGGDGSQTSGGHYVPSAPFGSDGPVSAIAVADDGTTYMGGDFTAIVRSTGCGVPVDGTTGEPLPVFPKVVGSFGSSGFVNAVAADGAGGWFIGGEFVYVGGISRPYIAHILADGSVDASWEPHITQDTSSPTIYALAVNGNTLYVGGWFNAIDGISRISLAALDTSTGQVTSWDPQVSAFGSITAIASDGESVYVGGYFTGIGGLPRKNIAALNAGTGDAEAWNPNPDMANYIDVKTLAVSGNTVYIGGSFHTIGGQPRNHIAAVDILTGLATAWNPDAASSNPTDALEVWAIAIRKNAVYAGGDFTIIGGQPRNHLAALDAATGNALAWDPNPTPNPLDFVQVKALAVSGNTVYVGGRFNYMGGKPIQYAAAVDAETGAARDWDPHPGYNEVKAIAASGNAVYLGGAFIAMGNYSRNRIASFDKDGNLTSWNPDADAAVSALTVSGGTVYAGGWFSKIGGQARTALAALDAATGNALDWNPNVVCGLTDLKFHFPLSPYVSSIIVNGATVYAGGRFTSIGGQPRDGIAALDAATGGATGWNVGAMAAPGTCCGLNPVPIPSNFVSFNALASDGSTLYAAGDFAAIGGQPRKNIAALDVTTGAATSWNPNPETGQVISVRAIALSADTVYIGGNFESIGSTARHSLAAIYASTAAITDWNPGPPPDQEANINALAVSRNTVYAGGKFSNMGGQIRANLTALDASTGSATGWDHGPNGAVEALAISGDFLYVSGNFTAIGLEPAGNLVRLNR